MRDSVRFGSWISSAVTFCVLGFLFQVPIVTSAEPQLPSGGPGRMRAGNA